MFLGIEEVEHLYKELGAYGITDLHTKFIHNNISSKQVWKLSEQKLEEIGISQKQIAKYFRAKRERNPVFSTKRYEGIVGKQKDLIYDSNGTF